MTDHAMSRRAFLTLGAGILAAGGLERAPAWAADGAPDAPPDVPPWHSGNPALSGAFEPVFDERDDANLPVRGEIPAGLNGVFMRNGPNPYFEPDALG